MRRDRRRRGHRGQVAPPLVEDQVEPEERLQPPAEARPRPPRPLRDRPDPPAGGAVEVQHAIRLAVADAAQHDRLGLERAGHARRCSHGRTAGRLSARRRGSPRRVTRGRDRCRPRSPRSGRWRRLPARGEAEGDVAVDVGEDRVDRAGDAGARHPRDARAGRLVERRVGHHADERRVALLEPRPVGRPLHRRDQLRRSTAAPPPRPAAPRAPLRPRRSRRRRC